MVAEKTQINQLIKKYRLVNQIRQEDMAKAIGVSRATLINYEKGGKMKHYAWVLEVRPGYENEYKKRHDEIWPEMVEMLSEAGLRNYNIFRHGLTLFGYFETDDLKKSIDHIVKSEVNKKWGEYMSDILKAEIDPKTNFPYLLPIQMHLD